MLALHDQSIVDYATMVFDLVTEFAEEQAYWDTSFLGERSEEAIMVCNARPKWLRTWAYQYAETKGRCRRSDTKIYHEVVPSEYRVYCLR